MPEIDSRVSHRQLRLCFDSQVAGLAVKQFGGEEPGNCAGIMQRRSQRAVFGCVMPVKKIEHACGRLRRRIVDRPNPLSPLLSCKNLVSNVETHHGDRHAAAKHDIGSMWVDQDVEFC
jgi:hypothetical protein